MLRIALFVCYQSKFLNAMKIILSCTECDFEAEGDTHKELMNKIVMWNHVKRSHGSMAERIMRHYKTLPNHIYTSSQPTFRPA